MTKPLLMGIFQCSTIMYFVLLLLPTYSIADQQVLAIDRGVNYKYYTSAQITASNIPGESISTFDRQLTWNTNDLSVPGNGLPINIGRIYDSMGTAKHQFSNKREFATSWRLNIPRIELTAWIKNGGILGSCGIDHIKTYDIYLNGVNDFKPVAKNASTNYPEGTLVHFKNNWIMICESYTTRSNSVLDSGESLPSNPKGITLVSPEGVKYRFSYYSDSYISYPSTDTHPLNTTNLYTYYISDVEDIHGNYLAYDYQKIIKGDNWSYLQLSKIRSKDGRVVNVTYVDDLIDNIKFEDQVVKYEYSATGRYKVLDTVRLPEGKTWEFDYYDVSYGDFEISVGIDSIPTGEIRTFDFVQLKDVKTPWGGDISYQWTLFQTWNTCSSIERFHELSSAIIGVHSREVSDLVNTYQYTYTNTFTDSEVITTFETPSKKEVYTNHCFKYTTENKNNGNLAKHGAVSKHEIYNKVTPSSFEKLMETNYTYETEFYGPDAANPSGDQITGLAMFGSKQSPHRLLTKKSIIDRAYTTETQNFDKFGNSLVTKESNIYTTSKKFTNQSYFHDTSSWVINLPKLKRVSTDGLNWQDLEENTYYSASSSIGYRFNPFQTKQSGLLQSTFNSYHSDGNLHRVTKNATNRWVQYRNYKRGIAQITEMPDRYNSNLIIKATKTVNDNGTISAIEDTNGSKTSYLYDYLNRTKFVGLQDSAQWFDVTINFENIVENDLDYLGAGLANLKDKQVFKSGNYEKTTFYDGFLNPVLIMERDLSAPNESLRIRKLRYNEEGKIVFKSYVSNESSSINGLYFEFDALNRNTRIIQSDTGRETTHQYLPIGNKIRTTNFNGKVFTNSFLAYGKPRYSLITKIEAPESVTTSLEYNIFDRVTSISQGSYTAEFVYDSNQRLCKSYRPETGWSYFESNGLGESTWMASGINNSNSSQCDRNVVPESSKTKFTIDNLGVIKFIDYPAGTSDITLRHDNNGNLEFASRAGSQWDYEYNRFNQVTKELLSIDNRTFETKYKYDHLANLSETTYPSGRVIDHFPDAYGQSGQAGIYASEATYHPSGALASFTYGNNKTYTMVQNELNLPYTIGVPNIVDLTYLYDGNNNVDSITDGLYPNESRSMSYDDLDRLDTVSGPWGFGKFTYDEVGNIETKSLGNKSYSFHYDKSTNRLDNVTGSKSYSFEYDDQGNVTNNGHYSFQYDKDNQLISVNFGTQSTYTNDANKKRVSTTINGTTTYSIYNLSGLLTHKLSTDDNKPIEYIYLSGSQVAKIEGAPVPQAPVTPTYISAPSTASSSYYYISWHASNYAKRYELQEKKNNEAWNTVFSGNSLNTQITGRTTGKYQYRISACNDIGCSTYRESGLTEVSYIGSIPSTPADLTTPILNSTGSFNVTWSSSTNATRYELDKKFNDGAWANVSSSSTQSFSLNNGLPGTHKFRVRACNFGGCSDYSSIKSTIITGARIDVPTGLSSPDYNKDGIYSVSWNYVNGANRYELQEKIDKGTYRTVSSSSSNKFLKRYAKSGTHYYRVRACNATSCSTYSTAKQTIVQILDIEPCSGTRLCDLR